MKNIQLLNKIAKCGTDIFNKDIYNVADTVENPDAIMGSPWEQKQERGTLLYLADKAKA